MGPLFIEWTCWITIYNDGFVGTSLSAKPIIYNDGREWWCSPLNCHWNGDGELLFPPMTYHWRIQNDENGHNSGSSSAIFLFATMDQAPTKPLEVRGRQRQFRYLEVTERRLDGTPWWSDWMMDMMGKRWKTSLKSPSLYLYNIYDMVYNL